MKKQIRPPIVCVLGHVDHGKTTLLDKIRDSSVAEKEAGGITQGIGASEVETKEGKKITFIDTPGHAAFASMRSRGAKVADIAILVVAADDGVKPQTQEALGYILAAQIPYIVAATKMDLPSASLESLKEQLVKEGVALEGKGGDTPIVPVSGKTGQGVEDLLEMVSLVAELTGIKGDVEAPLEAVVIETSKGKRGPQVSVIVREGTLAKGDELVTETVTARVRALFDYKEESVQKAGPGQPVQVLGFDELPPVGSRVWHLKGGEQLPETTKSNLPQQEPQEGQSLVIIKAKSTGSLEAILGNLPQGVFVVSSGVGDVSESDVFSAKAAELAYAREAYVLAFESKIPSGVAKLAETEGVVIRKFEVIYKLFEDLEKTLEEEKTQTSGEAQVVATFPYNDQKVAGCKVLKGKITKGDTLILMRDDKKLGQAKISSMKKQKTSIDQAVSGDEFGVIFKPQLDFKVGDMILSVINK